MADKDELLDLFAAACVVGPPCGLIVWAAFAASPLHSDVFKLLAVLAVLGLGFSGLVAYITACAIVYRTLKLLGVRLGFRS